MTFKTLLINYLADGSLVKLEDIWANIPSAFVNKESEEGSSEGEGGFKQFGSMLTQMVWIVLNVY